MGKKKGLGLNEVWTSVMRHYNNVFEDPGRQRIINLFLGIYNPLHNNVPIWNLTNDGDLHQCHQKENRVHNREHPELDGDKWWVPYLTDFEHSLPEQLRKDQSEVITRNPDSDSDDEMISTYIKRQMDLFEDENYSVNKKGLFALAGDQNAVHPLLSSKMAKKRGRQKLGSGEGFVDHY